MRFARVKLILLKALSWYFVHEHMSKQTRVTIHEFFPPKLFNCGSLEISDGGNELHTILSESTTFMLIDLIVYLLHGTLNASQYLVMETVYFML